MTGAAARPVVALMAGIGEYHVRLMEGMAGPLAERGIPLLVVVNEPFASDRTPSLVQDLIRRHVPRGVIALVDAIQARELPAVLARERVPTVALGTRLDGVPRIHGDNVGGMRALMTHLLDDCGVRNPVLARGVPYQPDSIVRERVFREELARRGLPVDEDLVIEGRFRHTETYDGMLRLLARRRDFDAVVALNDPSAVGALSAATDHGLRVPQDLVVSGFDGTDASQLSWPALTTVDQGLTDQGRRAVEVLLGLLDGSPRPRDVLVPARLVVRASTAVAAQGVLNSAAPEHLAAMPGARLVDGVPVIGIRELSERLEQVMTTARALQSRVTLQGAALSLSWAMANCRTVADIIEALDPCLSRLGVHRCFLGIDAGEAIGAAATAAGPGTADHPARLVLSYRAGVSEPVSSEVFSRHELLPPSLRGELGTGVLLLQALSIAGRERGYLLYEPAAECSLLTEALRIDLPRTVDTVLSTRELHDHTAMLEGLVDRRTRELQEANAELQLSVKRDGLTGIANRMAFQQLLETFEDSAVAGRRLAIVMIDVDMFKAYNDRYGHLAGDEALRAVGACLVRAIREPGDLACRYGGEEFAVVLADAGLPAATAVARRFRELLAERAIEHAASTVAPVLTVSAGVATTTVRPGVTPTELVAAADEALYRAKLCGRNRVVIAGHPDGPAPRDSGARPRSLSEPFGRSR